MTASRGCGASDALTRSFPQAGIQFFFSWLWVPAFAGTSGNYTTTVSRFAARVMPV
jgi:hypothetical protein